MNNNIKHCLSKIFQPMTIIPKNSNLSRQQVTSKSQRLMLELGIIQQSIPGCFHLLPLGLKSLEKLIKIVDDELFKIGGQKLLFPTLTKSQLWEKSGRLEDVGPELFQLEDRHKHSYILNPTHEEVAGELLSMLAPISYKSFPLRLYQISNKFRDEIKPRFGLMRGREFIMKDMYSFDVDIDNAKKTYEEVCQSYNNIFDAIGVEYVKILGNSGTMGGSLSHEYQFKAQIGEDNVLNCSSCNYTANTELCGDHKCPNCGETTINIQCGIEVGHTFYLGDKYSKVFNATYVGKDGKSEILQMGSYGIGISRLLAASLEVLSSENELRWPSVLAPYNVIILPPKSGSNEETPTEGRATDLYTKLENMIPCLKNNVLLDDRTSLTIGRRFVDAKRVGYQFIIVINKKTAQEVPLYELNDIKNNSQMYLTEEALIDYIKKNIRMNQT
ncbi:probable proline--tRNA ligase, mitochondrial isoform X2 [Diorhabda carinulata]|uniref:probable proline--tRNA ligase, mitochondrial isoform X2 n=1 Tax=Diorhabda carinulata TaxID=1163345 RepID=UPI0025A2ECF2|nr:probable proline--tRNA ligase, mitochondrial isoform X2 [Diorhabda carinulata]